MRHRNGYRKLNNATDQRLALLRSLSRAVIISGGINTTVTRAKETKKMLEKLLTTAKVDTVQARREVARLIPERALISKIFSISAQLIDRPGGYLRTSLLGRRRGDAVAIAKLTFVDELEEYKVEEALTKKEQKQLKKKEKRAKKEKTKAKA